MKQSNLSQLEQLAVVDKLLELRDVYKKKKQFTDEDSSSLKSVLKDLPGLKEVTHTIRNDILTFFDIFDLKPNEMLLKKENPPSIYILVQGSIKKSSYAPWNSYKEEEDKKELDIISQRQLFQEINGLQIFGNLDLLSIEKFRKGQTDWQPCFLYSIQQSIVYALNYDKVYKYMEKTINNLLIQEKQNFLLKNVPGLSNLLTSNRDKVLQMFNQVNFIQNQVIITEDTIPNEAYIIVEGHCSLQSKQIPVHMSMQQDERKKSELFIPLNKGYFSKTMNSFQIGIISENQWIANELLLIAQQERYNYLMQQVSAAQDNPNNSNSNSDMNMTSTKQQFNINKKTQEIQNFKKGQKSNANTIHYSVIAKTNVVAYAISKEDLVTKLPKDIQQQINKGAVKKQEWIRKRYQDIQSDVHKVFNMEQQYQKYVDQTKESVKMYPQANKQTIKLINDRSVSKLSDHDIEPNENPQKSYLKGVLNTQTVGFSQIQKSTSHNHLMRNKSQLAIITENNHVQKIPQQDLTSKGIQLPQIRDTLSKLVTHSETQKFHNNPVEAQNHNQDLSKSPKGYHERTPSKMLSLSDKISQTLIYNPENQSLTQINRSVDRKPMESAAACYKGHQSLYLPMLVRNSEVDKKLSIVSKNSQRLRKNEDEQLSRNQMNRKTEQLEVTVGDKQVKLISQLTERRYTQF